jgi:hypothetical protein
MDEEARVAQAPLPGTRKGRARPRGLEGTAVIFLLLDDRVAAGESINYQETGRDIEILK